MRKIAFLIASIMIASSVHAVSPVSASIGRVQGDVKEHSITAIALRAVSEDYTEAWLDAYASDKIAFGEAYSPLLSSVLPMDNPIASEERNSAVAIMDLSTGTVLSFMFRNGRIVAVSTAP